MNKRIILSFILFLAIMSAGFYAGKEKPYEQKNGFVPDEETAIKIAEAIWLPIYGKEIYEEKPFVAELSGDKKIWKVSGTLKEGYLGGVAYIEIRKSDCKVLNVAHGK